MAAHQGNHIVPGYFGPGSPVAEDSLAQDWRTLEGLLWLNPPFADIAPWVEKAALASIVGTRIVVLVPASVSTNWYADHVHGKAAVFPIRPRLTFVGETAPFPKDLMLAVYGLKAGFEPWKWNA